MGRRFSIWTMLAAGALALAASGWSSQGTITQDELVRNTQELFDAVAVGNKVPFEKYYADDVLFSDEKGRNMDKTALLKDVSPLPPGVSGTIRIIKPQSRIVGDTAVLSYDLDETETVFGQKLTARYHEIDTWMRRAGRWQIIATQVHRYYEDPAPGKADVSKFPSYVGTYQLSPERTLTITAENGHLYEQRKGRERQELIAEASDIFFIKDVEGRTLFGSSDDGKVVSLIDRRNNEDIVWKKTQ
ncbi:MAG TPA: DUF4440 domain-containing protein [Candidatus Angelobacter sp.]|nr:DUF4440 domain-containing protein [Candidatus Angelobacter sp.]